MASLQRERFDHYHVVFRLNGKRYKRSLNTRDQAIALSRKTAIEETIDLIQRGRLQIPNGVPPVDFVLSDGKLTAPTSNSTCPSCHETKHTPTPPNP